MNWDWSEFCAAFVIKAAGVMVNLVLKYAWARSEIDRTGQEVYT